MKNIKYIIGFAVFGFVLSFISGLFSGSHFWIILVHALIFAAAFGLIGFGITYLFDKYISGDSSSGSVSDVKTENGPAPSRKSEHTVDLVLESEDLPSDENSQQFFVGSQHQMLNQKDYANDSEEQSVKNEKFEKEDEEELDTLEDIAVANSQAKGSFIPMPLAETASNLSGKEAKTVKEVQSEEIKKNAASGADSVPSQSAQSEDLDSLPDLEELPEPVLSEDASPEEQMVEDSEFAKNGVPGKDADEFAKGKDAALMAKAISTLLKKE